MFFLQYERGGEESTPLFFETTRELTRSVQQEIRRVLEPVKGGLTFLRVRHDSGNVYKIKLVRLVVRLSIRGVGYLLL